MKLNLPTVVAAAFILAACATQSDEGSDANAGGSSAAPSTQTTSTPPSTQPVGPVPGSQEDLEVNVGDRVFFDFDRSTLRAEGRQTVERWAAFLETYPANKLLIEGHADERGTREYNLALGARRANAALEYLVSLGIDPNRVRTISYGKERPAQLGSSDAAYQANRRGVAVLEPATN